ncbi:replication-relaxation family protein [Glycomyces sp. MUSA5-2]|uniref:replication-relaxation family protein n=1 Tax=Glycomyces sp. MUSA5-2 TaxID=2053002 RepID=UPI00300A08AC
MVDALARHRVMTAAMVEVLFFPSPHAAAIRLLTLHEMGIVERYRSPGSRAYRYMLGWRGQCVHAGRHGEKQPSKQAATWKAQQYFLSAQRPHVEGINSFFCRIQYSARRHGDVRLVDWRSESDRSDFLYRRPDGTGQLDWDDGSSLYFYLEHDRSTETLERLASTVTGYRKHFAPHRRPTEVLLVEVVSERRLANLLVRLDSMWAEEMKGNAAPSSFTVAVSFASEPERTFTRHVDHPDAITDQRWHVPGQPGPMALVDLPGAVTRNWDIAESALWPPEVAP